jgi:aryl-alcohol dehydrogenase-like predicted oxidoreductase
MRYKRLGACGVKVSEVCLGTMNFGSKVDEATAISIVKRALDLGVNFIDTADVYSNGRSEEIVGKAIKDAREDIVLATKVRLRTGPWPNGEGLSRKHIMHAINESLRRLDTEYVDIYYVHRPSNAEFGVGYVGEPIPMEETLGALTDIVGSGKALYLGCSNFPAWLHCKALWTSDVNGLERYTVSQPVYNLLIREIEREIIPFCRDQHIGVVPYSALAGGALTGKYKAGTTPPSDSRGASGHQWFRTSGFDWEEPEHARIIEELRGFCQDTGRTMSQVALGWLLANPVVTSPIVGASSVKQLEENLSASEVPLSPNELERIEQITPSEGPYYT